MPFELRHVLVSRALQPSRHTSGTETYFNVSAQGQFAAVYPGRIEKRASATYTYRIKVDEPEGEGPPPLHGGYQTINKTIALTLRIFTPDGVEFTAAEIRLADLKKYRDRRGTPIGVWSYRLSGQGEHFQLDENTTITNAKGVFELASPAA